jgi:hypothetical protein
VPWYKVRVFFYITLSKTNNYLDTIFQDQLHTRLSCSRWESLWKRNKYYCTFCPKKSFFSDKIVKPPAEVAATASAEGLNPYKYKSYTYKYRTCYCVLQCWVCDLKIALRYIAISNFLLQCTTILQQSLWNKQKHDYLRIFIHPRENFEILGLICTTLNITIIVMDIKFSITKIL